MTKKEASGIFYLILIFGAIWLIQKIIEAFGGVENILIISVVIVIAIVFIAILSWISTQKANSQKRERLMNKYNDEYIVNNIMNKVVWQGQTATQVKESLGSPEDVAEKVLKTKKKEIWKYGHEGSNRYSHRVTLENDVVVGWEVR